MSLSGFSLIGFSKGATGGKTFRATNPATGETPAPDFHRAAAADAERAAALAAAAAPALAALSGKAKGAFLRAIAAKIEAGVPALAERAHLETGLPLARCQGELGRTTGQLRLFAGLVEEGSWTDSRIELAQPDRKPVPKVDHRSMYRAMGPVVVFCASNFPFAFSVAGGDTASAFAAGNPVIVKAHHAHPGAAELIGAIIIEAVRECGLPEGTFSLIFGEGREVGSLLVKHHAVCAVGFTGSRSGGRALMDQAAARPEPIPVYAEMSSLNPIFFFAGALESRFAALVEGLHGSMTMGVGQFCTNPGLLVLKKTPTAEKFVAELAAKLAGTAEGVMLNPTIHAAYGKGLADRLARPAVKLLARGVRGGAIACGAEPALFATDLAGFLNDHTLQEEIFGPSSLVVWVEDEADFVKVAAALEGNLTATLQATDAEVLAHGALVATLAERAGRVMVNNFPTGVEVSHAIVHGGPYPSLSDGGRTTSVGSRAIYRFSRLVCFQSFPDAARPEELRDANPLGLLRMIDGAYTRDAVKA